MGVLSHCIIITSPTGIVPRTLTRLSLHQSDPDEPVLFPHWIHTGFLGYWYYPIIMALSPSTLFTHSTNPKSQNFQVSQHDTTLLLLLWFGEPINEIYPKKKKKKKNKKKLKILGSFKEAHGTVRLSLTQPKKSSRGSNRPDAASGPATGAEHCHRVILL